MIIPAIDLIDGNVVRLYQGRYDSTTQYDFSPLGLRNQYAQAGADWLHIVDLSGAKDATKRQLALLTELMTASPLHIQVGGGVRSEQDVIDLLDAGAGRVVIGSLAIRQSELVQGWVRKYGGEQIVLALDVAINEKGEKTLPSHGWIEQSDITLEQVLDLYQQGGRELQSGRFIGDGRLHPVKSNFVKGFDLTAEERAAVLAFLQSLTDPHFISNPAYADPWPALPAAGSRSQP